AANEVVFNVRYKATATDPYSLTATITLPQLAGAPANANMIYDPSAGVYRLIMLTIGNSYQYSLTPDFASYISFTATMQFKELASAYQNPNLGDSLYVRAVIDGIPSAYVEVIYP
ncbi:MAG: hypothetical protein LBS18_05045, partial [Clostridiales bacterium]|nr:hypothetical protein [Clostridiales bacterium]